MSQHTDQNIFIIGTFGVGKSTIGRELARLLNKEFYDTDRMLEERLGVDISWIFDVEGEEKFFTREKILLQELVKKDNIILSTGGATIFSPENRKLLTDNGQVIALQTTLKQQIYRTQYNKYKRPFLRNADKLETEKRLSNFRERFDSLYQDIAETTFTTDKKNIKIVIKEILNYLEERS